ncbi:MAG: undecaprenyl/decaprenyl-phosphate alpha-N-acetylglucosaminyl 1-phosphate transferase [Elusimicrobia bacterium]|nr:undecaprenyl/decaprenyl-phosphate alpha-N-acetylglucosaminyl 1-phosphate transferase [Elusimicrobiota bacterium]
MSVQELYILSVAAAMSLSFMATPLVRELALRLGWMDAPSSAVKTHKVSTPCVGGIAIFLAFAATLLLLRLFTQFPTGTLRSLRGLLLGGSFIFIIGLLDDVTKPHGLHYKLKFAAQLAAAAALMYYGIRIKFVSPDYLGFCLTLLWVVGITNALNIIDIMDGLAASQAAIAALAFLMISLPSEELYVNFASAALAGAALGFLPWNFSSNRKMFMGDSGSMTLGFVLAAIAMGTKYSEINNLGVYAPLFILFVPMFDTLFVMFLRIRAGHSPFLGSKDHFALRLEQTGFSRHAVVAMAAAAAVFLGFCAWVVTQISLVWALCVYGVVGLWVFMLSRRLARVEMRP